MLKVFADRSDYITIRFLWSFRPGQAAASESLFTAENIEPFERKTYKALHAQWRFNRLPKSNKYDYNG
jgi:hypothetical protein